MNLDASLKILKYLVSPTLVLTICRFYKIDKRLLPGENYVQTTDTVASHL